MTKYIVLVTKQGKIIKFESFDVPYQGRGGQGIKAIAVREDDEVVSAFTIEE